MPHYHLRFMKGPNYTLNLEFEAVVEAASFEEALKPHADWPITESYDHATATAWNPGTCMYYQEMWEAALLPEGESKSWPRAMLSAPVWRVNAAATMLATIPARRW